MLGLLIGAVITSAAAAVFKPDPDFPSPGASVCTAVSEALNAGAVFDAKEPVCRRQLRFKAASAKFGLSAPYLRGVDLKSHRDLLTQMMMIGDPPVPDDQARRLVNNLIERPDIAIYAANFDPDNGGHDRTTYLLAENNCENSWFANPTFPVVFVEASSGRLDPYWGGGRDVMGYPFFYQRKTFYAKWYPTGKFLPPTLFVYEPFQVNEENHRMFKQETFALICKVVTN